MEYTMIDGVTVNRPIYSRRRVDYSGRMEYVNGEERLPMHIGEICDLAGWNKLLKYCSGIQKDYLHPNAHGGPGIWGNDSGIVSIKSTDSGRKRYTKDHVEDGVLHYETKRTHRDNFADDLHNFALVQAYIEGQRFLVFDGNNRELRYIGRGMVESIRVGEDHRSAVFRIGLDV